MLNMLNNDLVCKRDSLFSRENISLGVVMGFVSNSSETPCQ